MGIVYEPHQKSLNRQVALKILPFAAVLINDKSLGFATRLKRRLNCITLHSRSRFPVGQEQGVYYYAMQYIDGQSLEQGSPNCEPARIGCRTQLKLGEHETDQQRLCTMVPDRAIA